MDIDLSVCVAAGSRNVLNLLRTVEETADPVAVECLVVINTTDPGLTAEVSGQFPAALVYENLRENERCEPLTRAVNRALRLARGRYLAVFDESLTLDRGCLYRLLSFLDENPETGIAVPVIAAANGTPLTSARPLPGLVSLTLHHLGLDRILPGGPWIGKPWEAAGSGGRARPAQWAGEAAMVIRREVVEEVGCFGEGFDGLYADAEYCLRVRRHGWHIYQVPAASAVRHGERPAQSGWAAAAGACRYLVARWSDFRRLS